MKLGNGIHITCEDTINVVLGKNSSGKSTLLRLMDQKLNEQGACVRYITPERGGELKFEGGIETNRSGNPGWFERSRRKNQWTQFKQSSVAEFRNLETLVLRSIEQDLKVRKKRFTFDTEIKKINRLLDHIKLIRSESAGFDIVRKNDQQTAIASDLSSGESELITLAIEILYFSYKCKLNKYKDQENWLLLDEPDVHLHPDLQYRLMELLVSCFSDRSRKALGDRKVLIATHSTTIVSSLCDLHPNTRIGLMQTDIQETKFRQADKTWKAILPMFGAHPLSNIFNEKPPLIVEGEDDERIWQAAVRHSQGQVSVYSCVAGNVDSMNRHEKLANELMKNVYDNSKAYSLRDRDDAQEEIDDEGLVFRFRLNCRNAENLIVTDDVLDELDTNWKSLQADLEKWIKDHPEHPQYEDTVKFKESGWNRQEFQLKDLRNVIVSITGSTLSWEIAVGRSIAQLPEKRFNSEHCFGLLPVT